MQSETSRDNITAPHHNLARITPAKAREILTAIANLPDWPAVDEEGWPGVKKNIDAVTRLRALYGEMFKQEGTIDLLAFRNLIRKAWDSRDQRHREWYLFKIRDLYARTSRIRAIRNPVELGDVIERELRETRYAQNELEEAEKDLNKPVIARAALANLVTVSDWRKAEREEPPPMSIIETLMLHLQHSLRFAMHCGNPECEVTPYFFRAVKGEEYCSAQCKKWAKNKSQRNSWAKHPEWNKKRQRERRKHE